MKLGIKLLVAPLVMAVVVIGLSQVNLALTLAEASNVEHSLTSSFDDFRVLSNAQENIGLLHAGVYRNMGVIGSMDDAKIKAVRSELARQMAAIKAMIQGATHLASRDAESAAGVAKLGKLVDQYAAQADSAIDLSSIDPNTGIAAMQSADTSFKEMSAGMVALVKHVDVLEKAETQAARDRASRMNWIMMLVSAGALVAAMWLTWLMQRKVILALENACSLAGEVAKGNLSLQIDSQRKDEVGELLRSLGKMTQQLNHTMRDVQHSAESLQVTSAEIATGNHDLSNRTEQTASNLQAAASSLEQLTGTVSQTADASRQANLLATSAAEVAGRGGAVVSKVVATMDEINTSSRKIADIISVIDGIAFQTNILALNAAVEAARAGEQGRGFAVVATEVRSLAGRSAQAAREIKGLISASVERVEAGAKLVNDAGQTMTEIVGSVQRVVDIIGQITHAATEERDGISQVNASVVELDQMTQQNASLVEQSAAAASSLREHADRLAQLVGTFQLGGAAPRLTAPSLARLPG